MAFLNYWWKLTNNEQEDENSDKETMRSDKETMNSEAAMIKVTNIPGGTSKDALLFFFKDRWKSGGGSVEDIEYNPDTKSAVITFKDPEAVKRVIGKSPFLFLGVQIGVEEWHPDVKVDDFSEEPGEDLENILEVRGVSSMTREYTVMIYFENTRRSGGGEIKSMKSKHGVFYIIFEDERAIEKVLKRQHKIDGTAIEVCRYVLPPPTKPVSMYSNKVFITEINAKTTKSGLEYFLKDETNVTPVSIEYGELEGTAVVTFNQDIDFEKLQLACKEKTLDKSHLEISRVPVTNCAIVRNISERTSRDTLKDYFDNEKRSGVSGVLDVKMLDGFCLVYFEEAEAVDVVCKRAHRMDEQELDVMIYYECLGLKTDYVPFKPPNSLVISDFDPKKLKFLINSPPNQRTVEKQLETVYGKPIWPQKTKTYSLTIECTLTPETKDCRKIARHWETKVKENLSKFLDLLHVCKHTTLQEAFPLVLSGLKYLTISNPDAVAVVLGRSNYEIYVTGHKQAVTDVSKQVSDIIQMVDQELDRKKQQMQEDKHLKRHLVLILQSCKFEQVLQKKYKNISLKYVISKNLVKFEGPSGEVTSAIVEMYEFTSKVVKTEIKQFSKHLQQFLQQQPVYKYVNSKMKERNIIGIWEFFKEQETLTVFSMSDEQAVQAAHLIKESVIETPIKLKNESKALLTTKEWHSKVEEIEVIGHGLVKIKAQADQGRIIILYTDQWEGLALEYIEYFTLTITIYEESSSFEPAMMKYLQMNCAGDNVNVGKSIESEKVIFVVTNTGIVIKATKTGLNHANFASDKIVESVKKQTHSINKAGIRKHMESAAGHEKLKKVERSEGVVIQVNDESASDKDTSGFWLATGANRQELAVCVTKEGKKISAMVVDMLELDVDLIVSPANKDMKHIGGIAKFIVEKGGRSIQDECNDYVRKKGQLMEGQVFLSTAGNLKCKGVIHAVGPVWQNGTNQEEEYLREAVFKSLEVTSERRLTSIAFPALCTGVFGYPIREATKVIVVAVRDFFKENSCSPVKAVYLCDVKEDKVNGFVTALKREMKDVTVKVPEHGSHWKSGKTPVPSEAAMLKVTNIPDGTSEDALLFFFENRRKSGGGSVENLDYDLDTKTAVITFKEPKAIKNVLKKQHKINGTTIKVCRYIPHPQPKPVPMYPNKVFVTNISEKTNKLSLENFLEAKTNISPASIEYGKLEGTAIVTFEEDIDFEKLQRVCRKRTLDKSHFEISRVPITNCVIVKNIPEATCRDALEFYFDNKRRSGVSGVLDVKMLDGFCLVYFEEAGAVDVVCRRSHRIFGQDLDVKIYYECLGEVESDGEQFKPPGPLDIFNIDLKKIQFLIKSSPNKQGVDKQLEVVYGKPIRPKRAD